MKSLILIVTVLLITTSVVGQFDFKRNPSLSKKFDFIPDTLSQVIQERKSPLIDSLLNLEKNYDFQFRFWYSTMFYPSTSVFILTLRGEKWSARYFAPNKNWQVEGKQVSEIVVDQSKLYQLWELLVGNNVLTLPPQNLIRDQMVKYEIDTANLAYAEVGRRMALTDGATFNYQLITPKSSRFYTYHCPRTFLKHYSNIGELYYAAAIMLLIFKYVGVSDEGC